MAKRSRMSMLKRQREMQKNEKAARKRRKRHGHPEVAAQVPTATVNLAELMGKTPPADKGLQDPEPDNASQPQAGSPGGSRRP